jgi:CCR4-NOT transcriptional regulation complex NOT5 subunit
MTSNQLNSFDSQLIQAQQRASQAIQNSFQSNQASIQSSPIIAITQNPKSNVIASPISTNNTTTANNLAIQGLTDKINSRFFSFNSP